jgi:hypothetical protein
MSSLVQGRNYVGSCRPAPRRTLAGAGELGLAEGYKTSRKNQVSPC